MTDTSHTTLKMEYEEITQPMSMIHKCYMQKPPGVKIIKRIQQGSLEWYKRIIEFDLLWKELTKKNVANNVEVLKDVNT